MKTIKNVETGEIRRVENKEAELKNGNGWMFVAKSFWKALRGTNKVVKSEDESEPKTEKKTKRTTGDNKPYSKKTK